MSKPIKVLYEDDHLIAFEKPSGLLVIPSPREEESTLVAIVNDQYQDLSGPRLFPCHRLDRDTSGVILFAKGKRNQQLMMVEFQRMAVAKKYIAFVHGRLQNQAGEIRKPIVDTFTKKFAPGNKHFAKARTIKLSPKPAVTRYQIIDTYKDFSVAEVIPVTGRTNQIRIHFRDIGHPLVGEDVYAFRRDFPLRFRRIALHAQEISWRHPVLQKTITVVSPLPDDMTQFLEKH